MLVAAPRALGLATMSLFSARVSGDDPAPSWPAMGSRCCSSSKGVHPRFTIGESTIPRPRSCSASSAARYGVPEIGNLATYQRLNRCVGRATA